MSRVCTIGIDLGGTNIKAGLVDGDLAVVERVERPTDADRGPDGVIDSLVAAVGTLQERMRRASRAAPAALGIGTPGPLSALKGVVHRAVNLPGWQEVPLRDILSARTGLAAVMDNDANLAAYGEHCADPEVRDLVLLTLGTGVGAGAVIDGKILHGYHENASEWGHLIVHPGGIPCKCGQRGCLEMYASAESVARRVAEQVEAGAPCALGTASTVTAETVAQAARSGDAVCARMWEEACHALAIACVNIQHALNPRRVVLGGGMSGAGTFLLECVQRHFDAVRWHLHEDAPEIRLSILGNDAGIIGAAALARGLVDPDGSGQP